MKSISLILLAVAMTTFASPNPLEDRQVTCAAPGPLCGLSDPVTLSAPLVASVTLSVTGLPLPLPLSLPTVLTVDFTTTIGAGCSGAGCSCVTATHPLPSSIPAAVTLAETVHVTIPDVITTDVVLPSVAFSGVVPIPTITPPAIGVRTSFFIVCHKNLMYFLPSSDLWMIGSQDYNP